MHAVVRASPEDVDAALARLGLAVSPLLDAVRAGYLERASCTENDPPNFPGFVQWGRTLRALRERLLPLGWRRCEEGQHSTALREDGRVAVAVLSASEDTGRPDGAPTNRLRKGRSTVAAVRTNARQ